ncbi:IS66 family transposase [Pseudorhodobacter aquimaris]|uniref:IS66 family transposase n=1 Tax=Pseudorhodobacter aquimaris TaxID=687412 RepID=UPI0009FAD297|nr:transposase [Pseudorhodobacter aquimaris]
MRRPPSWYPFSSDRKEQHPKDHLAKYQGWMYADGYDGLEDPYRSADIHEVACMAHVRRKFVDIHRAQGSAIATEAIRRIATRFGIMASQMRGFIDTLGGFWARGGLANKSVSAMTSAQNNYGGQDTMLVSFCAKVMHWGGIIVAPGYTDEVVYKTGGTPYGYSHNAGEDFADEAKNAIDPQARRLVEIAGKLA